MSSCVHSDGALCTFTAAPYWLDKPQSQDVAENDTGTFHCRGEGIPEPRIKWLINGVPLTGELTHMHAHCHRSDVLIVIILL